MATLTKKPVPTTEEPSELVQFGKAIFDALKVEMEAAVAEAVVKAVEECIQEKIVSKILADALGQIGGIIKEMSGKAVDDKFADMQAFYINATKGLAEAIKSQPAPQFTLPETLVLKMPQPINNVTIPEKAIQVQVETKLAEIPFELNVRDKAFNVTVNEKKGRIEKEIKYNDHGQPAWIVEKHLD